MIVKNFQFYKAEKIPSLMEQKLNEFLEKNSFRFAIQNESPSTRKVTISLFVEPASEQVKATVKAKVFRSVSMEEAERNINEFFKGNVKMKFSTQSFVENNITTIIFYE